ncbi:unnamed protein product, partial [Medioppia subpectinata]
MFFISAFVLTLIVWLGLASVGHDFWIHRKYIEKLMKLFEYGRKRVVIVEHKIKERQRKLSRIREEAFVDTDDDEAEDVFDTFADKSANGGKNGDVFEHRRHRTMSLSINQEKKEFHV